MWGNVNVSRNGRRPAALYLHNQMQFSSGPQDMITLSGMPCTYRSPPAKPRFAEGALPEEPLQLVLHIEKTPATHAQSIVGIDQQPGSGLHQAEDI